MAETNNNEKNIQPTEFENLLKLYTEHTLKEDSALPPQTRVVNETISNVQKTLEAKDKSLEAEIKKLQQDLSDLDISSSTTAIDNFDKLNKAINSETDRSKTAEKNLSDRIDVEKDRLDVFLHGEAIENTAIDTLKEIQKWINEDETGTAKLITRVGNIETNLNEEADARKLADLKLEENINSLSKRVDFLEKEVVVISCGNSKV